MKLGIRKYVNLVIRDIIKILIQIIFIVIYAQGRFMVAMNVIMMKAILFVMLVPKDTY
jgi:hypothetical protein